MCLCAEWCGTCRDYRPLFQEVARAHPGLRFAWVDIEDHAEFADEFDVETFPTLLVAGPDGTRFLGPMLPNGQTLSRMLTALPPPQPSDEHVASTAGRAGALARRVPAAPVATSAAPRKSASANSTASGASDISECPASTVTTCASRALAASCARDGGRRHLVGSRPAGTAPGSAPPSMAASPLA